MFEWTYKLIAAIVSAFLLGLSTQNMLGAMQQSGYNGKTFMRWLLKRKNLYFNRLAVFALCLALAMAIVSLCFSFLGANWALLCSFIAFYGLCLLFMIADGKYALKVPLVYTHRANRLLVAYMVLTAVFAYGMLEGLGAISDMLGSDLYALLAYVPFAILPLVLPVIFRIANFIMGIFENARNRNFVKRMGQVLNETNIIRVGVVGSYGKTSVKNILKTLLSEKYSVVETPESYNTPIGVAKTVKSPEFSGKEIFIAEMGARKAGDIKELCQMVKPDYAVFTGICSQHIETFGSLENVWTEKSEILKCGAKKIVCGESLKERISSVENATVAELASVKNIRLGATETEFTLCVNGEDIAVKTALLGMAAVENILLAVTLCEQLGLTVKELKAGLKKVQPIPHRLQLLENAGVYILDDGYNCNPHGAKESVAALARFTGRKCLVTPGIVEGGMLEEELNAELGEEIAKANLDKVILVGDTLVGAVKSGYEAAGGDMEKLIVCTTLGGAQKLLEEWLIKGDCVLFLNDLPDVY